MKLIFPRASREYISEEGLDYRIYNSWWIRTQAIRVPYFQAQNDHNLTEFFLHLIIVIHTQRQFLCVSLRHSAQYFECVRSISKKVVAGLRASWRMTSSSRVYIPESRTRFAPIRQISSAPEVLESRLADSSRSLFHCVYVNQPRRFASIRMRGS